MDSLSAGQGVRRCFAGVGPSDHYQPREAAKRTEELVERSEIDSAKRRDVCNRVFFTGNEWTTREFLFEPSEAGLDGRARLLTDFGDLLDAVGGQPVQMHSNLTNGREQRQFHPAIPHLDCCAFESASAKQRGLEMAFLKIAADRVALGEESSVVQFPNEN